MILIKFLDLLLEVVGLNFLWDDKTCGTKKINFYVMFVEQVELYGFTHGTKRQACVKLCMAQKNKLQ